MMGLDGDFSEVRVYQREGDGTVTEVAGPLVFDESAGTVSFLVSHFTSFRAFAPLPTCLKLHFTEFERLAYGDDDATTASWNGSIPDALAAVFTAPDGFTSRGQTSWFDLRRDYVRLQRFSPFHDLDAQVINDRITIEVQMADVIPGSRPRAPDLQYLDVNDIDRDGDKDDTKNPLKLSEWTPIIQLEALNGKGHSFIRIRIRFELDANQGVWDNRVPYVDRLRISFAFPRE